MANYGTLTDLLIDQPERKLKKLETSIVHEIERLGGELKIVRSALARKAREREGTTTAGPKRKPSNGEGLSRGDLLAHVIRMNRDAFRPADVRDYLTTQGIVRRVEAVRNSLVRLVDDGHLERTADGSFAVPVSSGNGARVEAGLQSSLESGQV